MRATEIMTPDPACCTPDTPLSKVAKLMIDNDCGEIPIVESEQSRKLVGVVTDRDIVVRAVSTNKSADSAVSDIMTRDVVSVREDAELHECMAKMEDNQIRRIPVLDDRGRITGIIAQADIALHAGKTKTGEVVHDVSRSRH